MSFDDLGDRLESLGFARPDEEDGTWTGGDDVVARIGSLTPQLQYWTLLEDDGLVVTSDTAGYLAVATAAVVGDGERVDGLDDVVDPSGEPTSAVVLSGGYACEKLAMAQADGPDQDQAAELLAAAGPVSPLTGFALSAQPDGRVRACCRSRATPRRGRTPTHGPRWPPARRRGRAATSGTASRWPPRRRRAVRSCWSSHPWTAGTSCPT